MSDKLQVGSWDKLPHYSIGGDKVALYVWINEDGRGSNTEWIRGREAFELWSRFDKLAKKDKKGFVSLAKETMLKYSKAN